MFATLGRSWRYSTLSYRVLWNHKRLLVFPILSTIAAAIVVASFALPLWFSGALQEWTQPGNNAAADWPRQVGKYAVLLAFYFCNYFVIVFFNCALIAGVMVALNGEEPTVGSSLAVATRRLPQIAAWALVSAVLGVVLKTIENVHEKGGQLVASLLGSAWTVLTYFVVPSIVLEGLGPWAALKRSAGTLKATWGTALIGNFSLGLLGLLLLLPVYLVGIGSIVLGFYSGKLLLMVLGVAVGVIVIAFGVAMNSAAGVVFTAVLYSYATGHQVPLGIDRAELAEAFRGKNALDSSAT